jgi:hypothetical protein
MLARPISWSSYCKFPLIPYIIAMTVHLIKLCVGADSLEDLEQWQNQRLKEQKRARQAPELMHVTRHTPKRAEDVLAGGSLYWVIKGWLCARQALTELRPLTRNGVPHCGLVLDKELVRIHPRPCRAFQGWRYLHTKDAPPDIIKGKNDDDMPETLRRELAVLGLL